MKSVLHDLAITSTSMNTDPNRKLSAENKNMDQINSVTSIFKNLSPDPNWKLSAENDNMDQITSVTSIFKNLSPDLNWSAENENTDKDGTIQYLKQRICQLEETNRVLTEECSKTNIHLSKYTSPTRNVEYYHRTKEINKDNPEYKEKRKQINKRAYQKKKAKLLEKKNTSKKIDSEL